MSINNMGYNHIIQDRLMIKEKDMVLVDIYMIIINKCMKVNFWMINSMDMEGHYILIVIMKETGKIIINMDMVFKYLNMEAYWMVDGNIVFFKIIDIYSRKLLVKVFILIRDSWKLIFYVWLIDILLI